MVILLRVADGAGVVVAAGGPSLQVLAVPLPFAWDCGGNPQLAGRPTFVRSSELQEARSSEHDTPPELVGFDGATYEELDGEVDIAPDVWAEQLAWRAQAEGRVEGPTPQVVAWMDRLMRFDPRRVLFAHDRSVWEP